MGPVTAWADRVEIMPSLPAFGYSTKLCVQDEVRSLLLSLNCPVQRLRVTLSFLTQQCRVLVCR